MEHVVIVELVWQRSYFKMEHEALEILDTLHYGRVIADEDYSRLYDLVECLIGDYKTIQRMNNDNLIKLNAIKGVIG